MIKNTTTIKKYLKIFKKFMCKSTLHYITLKNELNIYLKLLIISVRLLS